MQIGSPTPWKAAPHAPPPVRGTPAPDAPAGTAPDRAAAPPGDRTRSSALAEAAGSGQADPSERPPEELAEIAKLQRRDREVRQHEAAHVAAGGAYVRGGASYSYQPGPDGRRYAVGGEVSIDASPIPDNPAATVAKMQRVRAAALAPARPSGQDLAVAARASQAEGRARAEAAAPTREAPGRGAASAPPDEGAATPAPSSAAAGALLDTYA